MTPEHDAPATSGNRRRKEPNPTPEQKAARAEAAEARAAANAHNKRTRELIQMGAVCAAFGFDGPNQVEKIMKALTRSKKGPDRLRSLGVKETDRWTS